MALLSGQVALVTGGGSGIGRAVVKAFVSHGARVGVLERDADRVAELNEVFQGAVHAVQGDVTSLSDNEKAASEVIAHFGQLDNLTCVAGIWDMNASLLDLPGESLSAAFDEMFAINVKGILLAAKVCSQHLIDRRGSIILTASTAAYHAGGGGPLYTASKYAVRGLVMQLGYELAPKVRVNGVAPGGTVTGLKALPSLGQESFRLHDVPNIAREMMDANPLEMAAKPDSHAGAYVYLASPELSGAVTGMVINSDGGLAVRGVSKVRGLPS